MRHVEVSKKIDLKKSANAEELKQSLAERLGQFCEIEKIGEGTENFIIHATTGSPASMTRDARLELEVSIRLEQQVARIIIAGFARAALSKQAMYLLLVVLLLLAGLLPGFFETGAEKSSPLDAIVFLIFGAFIIFDINAKLSEARENLGAALDSLETSYG